jgi:hypothetical protein
MWPAAGASCFSRRLASQTIAGYFQFGKHSERRGEGGAFRCTESPSEIAVEVELLKTAALPPSAKH